MAVYKCARYSLTATYLQHRLVAALLDDRVDECADTIAYPYPAVIAVLKHDSWLSGEPDALGRSSQDNRPRLKGGRLREERDCLPNSEDLVANNDNKVK
jgi:hypothetical protein